jgi:CheY-like chemotaxis protein
MFGRKSVLDEPQTRILVVDDDRDNLGLIHFILEKAGYQVLEANTGTRGIELARREKPDMILLDLAMPELDGWEVARILKSDPLTRGITLVALTVRSLSEDRRRAIEAGVDGYLNKPINLATFVEDVSRYLEKKPHGG